MMERIKIKDLPDAVLAGCINKDGTLTVYSDLQSSKIKRQLKQFRGKKKKKHFYKW